MKLVIKPGKLSLHDIKYLSEESTQMALDPSSHNAIFDSENTITKILAEGKIVYGINTGFGSLASTRIDDDNLELLQKSLVLSHAAGIGDFLSDEIVRLILALKINSLARGYSGVRLKLIEILIRLYNAKIYPCIPAQGSVGASGDLAPLAHMSTILLGIGSVRHEGKILNAVDALKIINCEPIALAPKEGIALLNGTQVSTAIALSAWFKTINIFNTALISGAMSVDAALGSDKPFDERLQAVRGHPQQIQVAAVLRKLLSGSEIRNSHLTCNKVQDPYSLRCQPQVMGACLAHIEFARDTLVLEANAVSDNPLVFADNNEIISGGNFHAEPVAMASDTLALAIAEIGALSERRIAMLTDSRFSGLPPFLVKNAGINSGFMIAHVTAASLASENKSLAHPASVDSLPTSANQEDHVSMATFAARRLIAMSENTTGIIAIELLAAAQGIDFRRPLKSSAILENMYAQIRKNVSFYESDRYFAPDIAAVRKLIEEQTFSLES